MNCRAARKPPDTSLSRRVTWALEQSEKPRSAYQLADLLTVATGRKHFPNSIYRALHRLREEGVVLQIVSCNGWQLRATHLTVPILVLLCQDCGHALQLSADHVGSALGQLLNSQQFRAHRHHLEMLGRCAACARLSSQAQSGGDPAPRVQH